MNPDRIKFDISLRSIWLVIGSLVAVSLIAKISDILLLLFVSIVFATALEPTVQVLEKRKIPRILAIVLLYIIFIGFIILISSLIIPAVATQVNTLTNNWPAYQDKLRDLFASQPTLANAVHDFFSKLGQNSSQIFGNVANVTLGVVSTIFGFVTFLILTFYMLSSGRRMGQQLVDFLPDKHWQQIARQFGKDVTEKLGYWLRGQAFLSLTIFVMSFIGLSIMRVDYALTLAVISGLTELLPVVGSYLGAIPAILVGLVMSPIKGLIVAAYYLVMQQFQGNVITPQVMKRALGVPPIVILCAILIGGRLFGFIGVVLAAPISALLSLVSEYALRERARSAKSRSLAD